MTYPIAFQLYSSRLFPPVRDHLPELAEMGYAAIEPWPPAYEDNPKVFRDALDAAGLGCFGFHMPLAGLDADPGRWVDIAQTLGARYLIPPFVPEPERKPTPEFWREVGNRLRRGSDVAQEQGLCVLWHNHDFEYAPLPDGSRPIDHILDAAGPDVGFEIDCGWVTRGGADPAAELARYSDRILAIQPKDMAPPGTQVDDGWTATGDGIIDWPALVPAFRATSADHIVTEHDNPGDWRVFARRSIDYLRHIGL